MFAPRNHAALLRSTALVICCVFALPAGARAASSTHKSHPPVTPAAPDSPFDPGDDARAELSRLVAEPGVVLRAYAPTGDGAEDPGVGLPGPDDIPVPDATPSLPTPAEPIAATPPRDAVAPASVAEDVDDAPIADDQAILDAATMERTLASWVGPEPTADDRPAPAEARRHKTRLAIQAFYADRGFAPLWIDAGRFDARGRSLLTRIDRAAEDGLDLRAMPVSVPHGGTPDTLASSELSLTDAAVDYGRQASGGRIDPARIDPLVAAKPEVADAAQVLSALGEASEVGEALRAFNPHHRGYALLRAKLAELRRASDVADRGPIPYGAVLKPGMRDARVPLVRARFGLDIAPGDRGTDQRLYDVKVASAVAEYQRSHGLPASGVLTSRTVASLSGGNPRRLEDEILSNMERWRWLPRDLGPRYIAVNIPDFSLDLVDAERSVLHARVVVGKPDHQTPIFSETMKFIIVNPYWNVPLSIVKKEMMPKLAADPNYFENHGYEVIDRGGQTYVRQPPGDSNALGRIKFMFPNRFSVYLHDTNARGLFGRDARALSHGCVRVDQPFKLAEAVLGPERGWTEARIARMVGGDERTINLARPLPVHINYFTAFVDDTGALRLRDDVYGYSAKVRSALAQSG